MKIFRTFFRSLRDALKSVIRNFSLSLASISCITITLVIITCSIVLSKNVANFTQEIEKDVTIVAFLNSDVTDEEREDFELSLKRMDNYESFEYQSKAEVKKEMEEENETFSAILKEWDDEENPLKDTYTIKVIDVDKIGETAKEIEKLDGVSSVQYGEGLVEQLVGAFDIVKKVTIIAAVALILVTIFLIINTIKLTIFSRKREISIMRLVGASNSRIKLPFVIEGIILGIIGSVIPILITIYGYTLLYNQLHGYVFSPVISLVKPMPFAFYVSLIILLIGMIVGMIGSSRAVRKYIKV